MNVKTVIKINYLVLALGLVLYAIFSLNKHGLGNSLSVLFGFQNPPTIQKSIKAKN